MKYAQFLAVFTCLYQQIFLSNLRTASIFKVGVLVLEFETSGNDLIITIVSQNYKNHVGLAEGCKRNIQTQALLENRGFPIFHVTHKDFPNYYMSPMVILVKVMRYYGDTTDRWVVFLEYDTGVNLGQLYRVLDKYNLSDEHYIGYFLSNAEYISQVRKECTPFVLSMPSLGYTSASSGFAITTKLLKRMGHRRLAKGEHMSLIPKCFLFTWSINRYRDIASYIWLTGNRRLVKHDPGFCWKRLPNCATYHQSFQQCGSAVLKEHIYFAVSTCRKFYKSRLQGIQDTWGQFVQLIRYFSDHADTRIPTIKLNGSHVIIGFCDKMKALMTYVKVDLKNLPHVKWIVLLDDDTTVSVYRLQLFLSCYDSTIPIAIGKGTFNQFPYLSGGGGRVLSRAAVELFIPEKCLCKWPTEAEDVSMGECFMSTNVSMIHSDFFHITVPDSSPKELLEFPITFHIKNVTYSRSVYQEYFLQDDLKSEKY